MRQLIDNSQLKNIEIDSAGIHAFDGDAVDHNAIKCATQYNVDLTSLRSRRVRADDYADFDLILPMDDDTVEYLELKRPLGDARYAKAQIKNILDYAPEFGRNVPNPYGTDGFDKVYVMREQACQNLLASLK